MASMELPKILLVEDDKHTLEGLTELLRQEKFDVFPVTSAEDALKVVESENIDLLLTDILLPGMDGKALINRVSAENPELITIMMTAFGTVKNAVEAMKKGVYYYLTKPIDVDELIIVISKALNERKLRIENLVLKSQIMNRYRFDNIIGNSGVMQEVFKNVTKVAPTDSTVLIRGESGTGKELIARALHFNSRRKSGPLIEVNCASLPPTLLETELFGHEKGAFTGAIKTKKGRFELADTGTIFLDEIGEISPDIQVKLLNVLQERQIVRVGGTKTLQINVRVIAATNSDLEKKIEAQHFRQDLYYRLNVIPIFLPPMRERKEDIPILIEHFIKKYVTRTDKVIKSISHEALMLCLNYPWPGNVREIENAIENAVVMCDSDSINVKDLPFHIKGQLITEVPKIDYDSMKDDAERKIIEDTLRITKGNKTKAAELLGISIRTMRYKSKKYSL